jgi:predicted flap endonuclease-1-like 5' DNA nuclease/FtsZ-binding cell division protein ZapB
MPDITAIHVTIIAAIAIVSTLLGWLIRGSRSRHEKAAVNLGWADRVAAQRSEHDRLIEQNRKLMEQVGQYQASSKDAKNRARELSGAVQEAFSRRDILQRDIRDIRSSLEVAVAERDQLQSEIADNAMQIPDTQTKDTRIARLETELENWQERLPPLIEKFQQRNDEALQLASDLAIANQRIADFETANRSASAEKIVDEDPDCPVTEEKTDNEDTWSGRRDALQKIKGIGPAIQKTLNEMGVFRFQQIAEMSEYDIDRVANRLKGFRSRIYREDWIGQAREFHGQDLSG